jgi:hypothetical protein
MARPLGVLPRAVQDGRPVRVAYGQLGLCAVLQRRQPLLLDAPAPRGENRARRHVRGSDGPGREPAAGCRDGRRGGPREQPPEVGRGAGWPARTPAPVRPQLVVCRPRSRCSPGPPASPGRRPVVLRGVVDRVGSDA